VADNSVKYMPPDGFFGVQFYKVQLWLGCVLNPTLGAYDAPSNPLVGWGGNTPSPPITHLQVNNLHLYRNAPLDKTEMYVY